MRIFCLIMFTWLCACTQDTTMQMAAPGRDITPASTTSVFVANARDSNAEGQIVDRQRAADLSYLAYDITIPPNHAPGQIEWPSGAADPTQHFTLAGAKTFDNRRMFLRQVATARNEPETFVFVHGFNTSHDEAVYRAAQMLHDFKVPGPGVLFSWPSAGRVSAYAYDRDSVLIARDKLAALLRDLSKDGRRVALVGHSMGSHLIMEALRQLNTGDRRVLRDGIAAVLLISPDLDDEVFRAQARATGTLPRPFYIVGTPQDRALRLSAALTGKKGRLGSLRDPEAFSDLGVTALDLSAITQGRGIEHDLLMTSPSAIAVLERLDQDNDLFDRDIPVGALFWDRLLPGGS